MLTHQHDYVQVLQQYGAAFVSIQSYNTTQASAGARKLQRKLLSHAAHHPCTGRPWGRRLTQASSSGGMLQVDMMVTVPAEQQLQVLSPGTTSKASQSLTASGMLSSLPPRVCSPIFHPPVPLISAAVQEHSLCLQSLPELLVQLLPCAASAMSRRQVPVAHAARTHGSACTQQQSWGLFHHMQLFLLQESVNLEFHCQ